MWGLLMASGGGIQLLCSIEGRGSWMIQWDQGTSCRTWEALQLQLRVLPWASLSGMDMKGPRLCLQVRFRGFEVLNKSPQPF